MTTAWVYLAAAIAAEIAATSQLPRTEGFRRPLWSGLVLLGYATAYFLLAQTLETLDVGVAYALWSGLGTMAIAVIGMVFLGERASALKALGVGLVVVGVVVLNLGGA